MQLLEAGADGKEANLSCRSDIADQEYAGAAPVAKSSTAADPRPAVSCKTRGGRGSIPFKWEKEPGIPKIHVTEEPISPLHPPPSHHASNSVRSSPRAIPNATARPGGMERSASPLNSQLERQTLFSAHTSPSSFSRKLKNMISAGKQRYSLDVTQNLQTHSTGPGKSASSFLEQVSHLHSHSYSTFVSADDHSDNESNFYTPMYSATPVSSYSSVSPKQAHDWEISSLSNALENASLDREYEEMQGGTISTDCAPSVSHLQSKGDGSFHLLDSTAVEYTLHEQPASEVDSQICNYNSEESPSSPETSLSSLSKKSVNMQPIPLAGRRYVSMKLHHGHEHPDHKADVGSFHSKRKLSRARTMNCYPLPSNDSDRFSSETSFGLSGSISSDTLISEHMESAMYAKPKEAEIAHDKIVQNLEPQMDLSVFTLCRSSSVNNTITKRSLYDYDKSTSMQLLKSVDNDTSYGLAPLDMDKEISKQFLWLTNKSLGVSRGQNRPFLRRSLTTRMPFRSLLGKLVPCISTSIHQH